MKKSNIKKEIQWFRKLISLSKIDGNSIPCYYCGCIADQKEHVIPVSYIKKLEELKSLDFEIKMPKIEIVPSCEECNYLAGSKVFKNKTLKKEYIKKKLREKYKKILNSPNWTDEEIAELSGDLQKRIILYEEAKKVIWKRINY